MVELGTALLGALVFILAAWGKARPASSLSFLRGRRIEEEARKLPEIPWKGIALGAGAAAVLLLLRMPPLVVGGGVLGAVLLPKLLERKQAEIAKIEEDIPHVLALLTSAAGLQESIPALLAEAAQDLEQSGRKGLLPEMLRQAALIARSQGELQALSWLEREAPVPALARLAALLRIYAVKGGEFARVMQASAQSMRTIISAKLTARAKAGAALGTARFLMILAVGVCAVGLTRDEQARAFYSSTPGQMALLVVAGMMAAGYFIIKKMAEEVE